MADVLREAIVSIKSTFDNSGLTAAEKGLKSLTNAAASVVAALGLKSVVQGAIQFGDALADTSLQLGVSVETLQEYGYVAELAGVNTETFAKGVSFLNAKIGEAQQGNAGAVKAFSELGISLKAANGQFKTLEQILEEVPDGLRRLKTDSQRVAVASKLFGRSGKQQALVLAQNSEAIKGQIAELRRYGGVLSGETARGLDQVSDRMLLVNKAWNVFAADILFRGKELFLDAIEKASGFINLIKDLDKQFGILKPIIYGVGLALAAVFGPTLLKLVPVVALFTALGIAVEELIGLFTGQKTVIGAFLVELLGFEKAKALIDGIKTSFAAFISFVQSDGIDVMKRFFLILIAPARVLGDLVADLVFSFKALAQVASGDFKGAFKTLSKLVLPGKEAIQDVANTISLETPKIPVPKNFEFGIQNPELVKNALAGSTVGPSIQNAAQLSQAVSGGISNSNSTTNQSNNVAATFNIQSNDPHEVARVVNEQLGGMLSSAMNSTVKESN